MESSLDVRSGDIRLDAAFFVAIVATGLALGGALAHAFELPNKIGLGREEYFIVQQIYAGWDRLAYVLIVQLLGILAVVLLYRRRSIVFWPAVVALGAFASAQAIFWMWTYPANQATANWTEQPANWESLRTQWEYSHLAGAVFQAIVLIALVVALLRRSE